MATVDRTYRMPEDTLAKLELMAERHHAGNRSAALRAAIDLAYERVILTHARDDSEGRKNGH